MTCVSDRIEISAGATLLMPGELVKTVRNA